LACLLLCLAVALVFVAPASAQVVYTYEDAPASAVPIPEELNQANCTATAGGIVRTINVPDSFNVGAAGTIALGLVVQHTSRDQIRAFLTAPNGNNVQFLTGPDTGDTNDNYNITVSDPHDGTAPVNDGSIDPLSVASGTAFYRRLVNFTNFSSTLYPSAGNVSGNWTLRICDVADAGTPGTFVRARLTLRDDATTSVPAQCGVNSTFNWTTLTTTPVTAVDTKMADGTTWTIGGIQWTQTQTVEATGDTAIRPSFRRENLTTGNVPGYYISWMAMLDQGDGTTSEPNAVETARFTFNPPVVGMDFELLDVDQQDADGTDNDWEDQISVAGFNAAGQRVPYLSTFVGPTPTLSRVGDWVESDGSNVANDSTSGNVRFRFAGAVSSIIVAYAQANEPATGAAQQRVGISRPLFCAFDFGDAPSPYLVTTAAAGPRHIVGSRTVFIGLAPDGESDGSNSTNADSDQVSNPDEAPAQSLPSGIPTYIPQGGQVCNAGGGVTYTTPNPGGAIGAPGQYCLVVAASNTSANPATLVGWIDFNNDNDFNDTGERSRADLGGTGTVETFSAGNIAASSTGNRILVWDNVQVPSGTISTAAKVLRLRISTDNTAGTGLRIADPQPNTLATDGEVEDHLLPANTLPVTLAQIEVQRVDADTLSIGWTTATETGTRGFRVLQLQADRTVASISQRLVPSARMSTTRPSDYRIRVTTTSNAPIYLEEVAVNGKTERFGPFAVGASVGARPQVSAPFWLAARSEVTAATTREDGARRARAAQRGAGPAAEVRVAKTGWQQVPLSTLSAAGIDFVGQPVAGLRLRHGETSVPFRVAGGSATLGASSVIEFWGEAVEGNLYTTVRPYVLDVGAGGQPMAVEDGTPLPGPAATLGSAERALDEDRDYSVTSPNGDPWHFDMLTRDGAAIAGKQWTLDLPGVHTSAPARVKLALWGGVGIPELAQDHRYRLTINGTVIGEDGFDGVTAHEGLFDVPAGVLVAGENTVRLDLIETGDTFDRVFVERIAIAHTARLAALDGYIDVPSYEFVGVPERVFADGLENDPTAPIDCGVGCEQIDVVGLQSPDVLALRLTSTGAAELSGVAVRPVAGGYAARVRSAAITAGGGDGGPDAGRIIVVDRSRAVQPAVRPAIVLDDPAIGGPNDLMIISSTRFAGSVGNLVAAREAEGLRVRVVTVEQIYAHYSDGIVDPEGIRRFVARAAQQLGTRYVLLVGGDTYDYFDRYATGSISDVPTLYRKTHEYVSFAPVDPAFGDVDDDGRPDVSVGRLPARTTAELQSLIAKVLEPLPANAYTGLFAAERSNPAEGIDYDARVTDWVSALGPAWQSGMSRLNLDDYPATAAGTLAARNEFVGQVNQGRNWVSYYGHASPATWSRETLLDADFLPGLLNNAGKSPVVTEFGCWGGYFVEPTYTTLNHAWLLSPGRGARAMIASSSLTEAQSDQAIAAALLPQFSTPGIRLGDALLNAQGAVFTSKPEMKDVIYGMSLFGDPSARLTPPN
jgi:hypothetical protein